MANTSIDGSFSATRCRGACKRTFVQRQPCSARRFPGIRTRRHQQVGFSPHGCAQNGLPQVLLFMLHPPVPGRPDQPVDTFEPLRHEYVVDVAFPITDANDVSGSLRRGLAETSSAGPAIFFWPAPPGVV